MPLVVPAEKVPTRSPRSIPNRVDARRPTAQPGWPPRRRSPVRLPALLHGDDGAVAVHPAAVEQDVADEERGVLHGAFHGPSSDECASDVLSERAFRGGRRPCPGADAPGGPPRSRLIAAGPALIGRRWSSSILGRAGRPLGLGPRPRPGPPARPSLDRQVPITVHGRPRRHRHHPSPFTLSFTPAWLDADAGGRGWRRSRTRGAVRMDMTGSDGIFRRARGAFPRVDRAPRDAARPVGRGLGHPSVCQWWIRTVRSGSPGRLGALSFPAKGSGAWPW